MRSSSGFRRTATLLRSTGGGRLPALAPATTLRVSLSTRRAHAPPAVGAGVVRAVSCTISRGGFCAWRPTSVAGFCSSPMLPEKRSASSVPTDQVPRRSTAMVSTDTRSAPGPGAGEAVAGAAPADAARTKKPKKTEAVRAPRGPRAGVMARKAITGPRHSYNDGPGRSGDPTMAIGKSEVRHIARLANLDFSDEEYDRFTHQLNAILEYVAQLDRLDTSAIEATSHAGSETGPLRED